MEPEPEVHEESFAVDALDGMASGWETSSDIRQGFRERKELLVWPKAVGVPSMILDCIFPHLPGEGC
jgi:hypothetical protein